MALPSDGLPTEVKDSVTTTVEELKEIINQQTAAAKQQKEALEQQKKALEHHTAAVEHHTAVMEHHTAVVEHHTAAVEHHTAAVEHHTAVVEHYTAAVEHHTAVVEHHTAAVEKHAAAVQQQKESLEHQTAALLLAPVSVSLPLSLQEVTALATREEEMARQVGKNKGVSLRLDCRFIIEGATGPGAVEETKMIVRNFVEDAKSGVKNSYDSARSHKEELVIAKGTRSCEECKSKKAESEGLIVQRNKMDVSEATLGTDEELFVTGSKVDGERSWAKICQSQTQVETTEPGRGMEVQTLLVTQIEADVLMNKKGLVIKAIERDTATEISVTECKIEGKRKVVIRGSEEAIEGAKLKLKEAINLKYDTFLVTHIEANALRINKADVIRTIQVDTSTIIDIEGSRGSTNRRVKIVGSEKSLVSAKLKIEEAISMMKHTTLLVTGAEVDILLRNKAEIIRTIEGDTGTSIAVEGNRGDRKRSLVISGSEHAVRAAELKIKHVQK